MAKRQTCKACRGFGHDKKSQPRVEFREELDEGGKLVRKHRTLQQGSGCLTCLGVGYVQKS